MERPNDSYKALETKFLLSLGGRTKLWPLNLEWPPFVDPPRLPRTVSQAFLSQPKVVLFGRAGVRRASE